MYVVTRIRYSYFFLMSFISAWTLLFGCQICNKTTSFLMQIYLINIIYSGLNSEYHFEVC